MQVVGREREREGAVWKVRGVVCLSHGRPVLVGVHTCRQGERGAAGCLGHIEVGDGEIAREDEVAEQLRRARREAK